MMQKKIQFAQWTHCFRMLALVAGVIYSGRN